MTAWKVVLFFVAAAVIACGLGLMVYPAYPALVWVLLFVCWACYRLKMRAAAQFAHLRPSNLPADEDEDEE